MEAAGQAEMRVSIKSETGTVDVRAMLEGSHISATVAAQHSGTRDWLLSNLHELHSMLSRDDLNLRTFEVTDTALQNEGRQTHSGQQEQQQNLGVPAQFRKDGRSTTEVFFDLETNETASQALSLHA
jgi:flagellar hook-length control protein FliK